MKRSHILVGLLAVSLLAASAAAEVESHYYAVMLQGKKIGHMVTTRTAEADKVANQATMDMTLGRAGVQIHMKVETTTVETPDGKPLSFRMKQDAAIMAMEVEGTIQPDGTIELTTTSAGQTTKRTAEYPKGALMSEGLDLLTRKVPLKEGATISAIVFEPTSLKGLKATMTVGPKRKVDLFGRVVTLTEVKTVTTAGGNDIVETSYVDEDRKPLKTVMDLLGMKLEVLACSREFALSKNDTVEFFTKVLLASPEPLKGVDSAESMVYHLTPKADAKLKVPSLDGQTVGPGKDGVVIVTVTRLPAPAGQAMPYAGKDKAALAALKPTGFLQSDRKEVTALAREAVGDAKDAAQAAKRIRDFVHKYINKKNLSVGYATAAEVVASREGDCSEHAVLAAAMCRAAGIPAQVVFGFTYVSDFGEHKDVFGPHAWFRVWLDGKWIQMDATPANGWDVGHLALAAGDGDIEDFFQIIALMGNFTISKVAVGK